MKVGNTEYEWEGLIDNAIHALDDCDFRWTKYMIKQHFPELKKEYEKAVEDQIILKKIRLYCEGKSVVDTMELIKLGL